MSTVDDLLKKAMVFDPALENADPAIIFHREVAYADLTDTDLEDMYTYQYPMNVQWLIKIRPDWIKKYHPEHLQ